MSNLTKSLEILDINEMQSKHIHKGGCHCGTISFELETTKKITDFIPRACACNFCQKHEASYISDPTGILRIHYKDKNLVNTYRFGHGTADFIICKKCGVFTMTLCEIEERTHAVVNVKTMEETLLIAPPIATNFDGESIEKRLERRQKNWIGTVRVSSESV